MQHVLPDKIYAYRSVTFPKKPRSVNNSYAFDPRAIERTYLGIKTFKNFLD